MNLADLERHAAAAEARDRAPPAATVGTPFTGEEVGVADRILPARGVWGPRGMNGWVLAERDRLQEDREPRWIMLGGADPEAVRADALRQHHREETS